MMIKPKMLEKGDKVAMVCLSSGNIGEPDYIHKFHIAKKRLEKEFGLELVAMPSSLKGRDFIYEHPEARVQDLMDAFKTESIKAIICAIGGDDTIRTLPYIDYDVIRNNPKIFMGYSDTTVNHFMMNKAGLVSFYGPTVMVEFGEYVKMFDYTKTAILDILFNDTDKYEIKSSEYWSDDFIPWKEENVNIGKKLRPEEHGFEVLQGSGFIEGQFLGGCIDVFPMINGTELWPTLEEWKDKILLIETSEERPSPNLITWYLRNLGAQGILKVIKCIVVGKPQAEEYYEEYKEVYKRVLKEYHLENLPVLYNVNIGHAFPTGLLPLGTDVGIDFDNKKMYLMESPVKSITKNHTI